MLVGRRLNGIDRRGHFMRFGLDGDLVVVVNAMLVGRYRLIAGRRHGRKAKKDPRALGLALTFDDAPELQYLDEKRMGKVYVARAADEGTIPVYGQLGLDVMSPAFTRDAFGKADRAAARSGARVRDGQARARVDRQRVRRRDPVRGAPPPEDVLQQAGRRRRSTRCTPRSGACCADAIAEIRRRDEPIEIKVRDFLKVRGRDGKPCLVCGTTIRAVRVGDGDACFCPQLSARDAQAVHQLDAAQRCASADPLQQRTEKSRPPSRR